MSDDLERRLREFPREFPRPDEPVTRKLEERVLTLLPRLRRRSRVAALVAGLLGAAAVGAAIGHWSAPAAATDAATFRSVDMTVICTTEGPRGYREVSVRASPRLKGPAYSFPGSAGVSTGVGFGETSLAGITGKPDDDRPGVIYVHRTRCGLTRARIPMTRKGLPGPPAIHGTDADCVVGARVILRLRATLASPGPWVVFGRKRELRGIRRSVVTGAIAVRTWPKRRPLGYLTLDAAGNTRLFSAATCLD